ncbi:MAG TPA: nucleotidyltransferase domain-containing protein [Candidatus Tripitaka californicus]|uniref:nucleotidyltransferase domain-containing protein n=1 Tax=Candidatus Tripitaka californicus TaxID=3367616 RepID=UPI004025D79F
MPKLCRVNIERREEILEALRDFVKELKEKLPVHEVFLYGSFATGNIHEGSDIDLIIVGDFKERFVERIGKILEMTDLPVEPLVYTPEEFKAMQEGRNPFIMEVLRSGKKL